MTFQRLIIRTLIGVFLIGSLAQCGKKTLSGLVTVTVIPTQPVIITGDATIAGKTITAPWYTFTLQVTNNSGEPLTFVAISTETTLEGDSTNGNSPVDKSFTSSELDISTSNQTCNYDGYFDTIPSDGKPHALSTSLTSGDSSCSSTITNIAFYADQNTKPTNNVYLYQVKLTPQGWFGTATEATKRFDRSYYLTTQ